MACHDCCLLPLLPVAQSSAHAGCVCVVGGGLEEAHLDLVAPQGSVHFDRGAGGQVTGGGRANAAIPPGCVPSRLLCLLPVFQPSVCVSHVTHCVARAGGSGGPLVRRVAAATCRALCVIVIDMAATAGSR